MLFNGAMIHFHHCMAQQNTQFYSWDRNYTDILLLTAQSVNIMNSDAQLFLASTVMTKTLKGNYHRLKMELDLQSFFGLHVQAELYSSAQSPQPPSPAFGLMYEGTTGQPG
jgi:hypothetical protein